MASKGVCCGVSLTSTVPRVMIILPVYILVRKATVCFIILLLARLLDNRG